LARFDTGFQPAAALDFFEPGLLRAGWSERARV
jgi:hypothetical protein